MRRSILIVSVILASLFLTPISASADEVKFDLREMNPKPGYCKGQFMDVLMDIEIDPDDAGIMRSAESVAKKELRQRICDKYITENGYQRVHDPGSYGYCGHEDQLAEIEHCQCWYGVVIYCWDSNTKVEPKKKKSSVSADTRKILSAATDLVAEIAKLVAVARAQNLSVEVDLGGPEKSGSNYETKSRKADDLYDEGFAAMQPKVVKREGKKDLKIVTHKKRLEAFTAFSACLEIDPNHVQCMWELGWAFHAHGVYEFTEILWDRVKQLDPNHRQVDRELEKLQKKLN